jgi:hypothetical protein
LAKVPLEVGVSQSYVRRLLATYYHDRIAKQLLWLLHRNARRQSLPIIAAVDRE